jgi:acyl-CoA dehydrogenase
MMDFSLDPDLERLRDRVRAFVADAVIPAEDADRSEHGLDDGLRARLQVAAREAGVFAPTVAAELGGLGLDHRAQSIVLEEAGYSILGPQAMNCAAPDEGNMNLLAKVASPDQRERYLRPLAAGEIRSAFAMTEPAPGAGSDPAMLLTRAERVEDGWSISGRKWFITGAAGARFFICMARTSEVIERGRGATMFLVDADHPGVRVDRIVEAIDRSFPGGHAEVVFEDCRVGDDAVLGEVGEGYGYAQVRLAPARLTHCMRWLGLARRAHDVALDRTAERELFGARLDQLGLAQGLIADSVIDLAASSALIQTAADALAAGRRAAQETSIAKVFVSEAVFRVVDRSIQLLGGDGVVHDLPVARFLTEVRPFRIYDGPSETHRWAISRRASRLRGAEREA